jgi:predicted amidohydrolase YtcJ
LKGSKVFFNGKIYTQVSGLRPVDSMIVTGNEITAVGTDLDRDVDKSARRKINLQGRTVLPGFTDAHTHFGYLAFSLGNIRLENCRSLEEVLEIIAAQARKSGRKEWVVGEGFLPDGWRRRIIPDRFMLDKVTGGRPAVIYSKDQHTVWANSRAMAEAGITAMTPEPAGGKIERLQNNEPSGILREKPAFLPVIRIIDRPGVSKKRELYKEAVKMAYSRGITAVHSFDGMEFFEFFDSLARKGLLGLRINYYFPAESLAILSGRGIRSGYGNDYFRVSGIKIFADGSLGSQTALCFNTYKGMGKYCGVEVTSPKDILAAIRKAARLGLPCAVHAIGDKAVANVLDCFEDAPRLRGAVRHRIEHVQMIRRKDIRRLKELDVIASMQPSHCPFDVPLIEKYWGGRGRNCYLFNTLIKNGIPVAFGSDAPIEPLDPLAGICAAVNRIPARGGKPFYPDERISVDSAVYGFTVGPARAVGQEQERGYLLPGYKADFIILSDNIYEMNPANLQESRVLATFFDGELVYSNGITDLLS